MLISAARLLRIVEETVSADDCFSAQRAVLGISTAGDCSSSSARQPQSLAGPMSTRLEKSMFRYPVEHGAAFVELRHDTMSGEKVFQYLETVSCVGRVYWQISKHAQGNKNLRPVGTPYTGVCHLLAQNVMVRVRVKSGFAVYCALQANAHNALATSLSVHHFGQVVWHAWPILLRRCFVSLLPHAADSCR